MTETETEHHEPTTAGDPTPTAEQRLAAAEARIALLETHFGAFLTMVANEYMARKFADDAGRWPSKNAMVSGCARLVYNETMRGVLQFARENLVASDRADEAPARLMVRAIERVEAQLDEAGRQLSAELQARHAEVFKP